MHMIIGVVCLFIGPFHRFWEGTFEGLVCVFVHVSCACSHRSLFSIRAGFVYLFAWVFFVDVFKDLGGNARAGHHYHGMSRI